MASRTALKEWRETYGMKRDEARFFIDANMDFTQASEWLAASIKPDRAAMYYSRGISIENALRYEAVSDGKISETQLSVRWQMKITLDEMEEWVRRGFSYIDPIVFTTHIISGYGVFPVVNARQYRWEVELYPKDLRGFDRDTFARSFDTASQWRDAGFSGIDANEWMHQRFSPEDASVWREATRTDRDPNGKPEWAIEGRRAEMTPEEYAPWAAIGVWNPREWVDAGLTPEDVSAWAKANRFDHAYFEDVAALIDLGMTPDDLKPWSDAGVPVSDVIDNLRGGYSLEQVKDWMAKGYQAGDMGVTGQELYLLRVNRADHWARETIVYINIASEATDDNRRMYVSKAREAWALLSRQVEEMFAEIGENPVEV